MKRTVSGIVGILAAVMLSALLSACGGGGGGSSSAKTAVKGIFANVSGMGYSSGSQTGTTGSSGAFTYVAGDTAIFKVGDINIGQATAGSLLTPLHLFPDADAATTNVVNIMRFLMSIGNYDAAGLTISIPSAVLNAAMGKSIDFALASDQALLDLVRQLTGNNSATLVDAATATAFLSKIIYKYYAGVYTGTFTGGASSNRWSMTINNTGTVAGQGTDGAQELLNGSMTNGLNFSGFASGGCALEGKLNVFTGKLSGNWQYPLDATKKGTFDGTR